MSLSPPCVSEATHWSHPRKATAVIFLQCPLFLSTFHPPLSFFSFSSDDPPILVVVGLVSGNLIVSVYRLTRESYYFFPLSKPQFQFLLLVVSFSFSPLSLHRIFSLSSCSRLPVVCIVAVRTELPSPSHTNLLALHMNSVPFNFLAIDPSLLPLCCLLTFSLLLVFCVAPPHAHYRIHFHPDTTNLSLIIFPFQPDALLSSQSSSVDHVSFKNSFHSSSAPCHSSWCSATITRSSAYMISLRAPVVLIFLLICSIIAQRPKLKKGSIKDLPLPEV